MAKVLKRMAWVLMVLSFIAGLIIGYEMASIPEYTFEDKSFSWSNALMVWGPGIIGSLFILAFSELLEHVSTISSRLQMVERSLNQICANTSQSANVFSASTVPNFTDTTGSSPASADFHDDVAVSSDSSSSIRTCPNCNRAWTEPLETKKGKPAYCRACQEHYANREKYYSK